MEKRNLTRSLTVVLGLAAGFCASAQEAPPTDAAAPLPPIEPAAAPAPRPPLEPSPAPTHAPAYAPAYPAPDDAGYARPERPPRQIQSGFTLAVREGLAFPGGSLYRNAPLSSWLFAAIPVQLEAGVRFPIGLALGGYVQMAPGMPDCPADVTCVAMLWRVGLQADVRFNQRGRAMPWVGGSIGLEGIVLAWDDAYGSADETMSGTEIGLQGGVDFRVGNHFAVGPYAQYTVTTYDEYSYSDDSTDESGKIPEADQAEHTWFTVGIKGTATF